MGPERLRRSSRDRLEVGERLGATGSGTKSLGVAQQAGAPLSGSVQETAAHLDDGGLHDHPQRVERYVREEESGERQVCPLGAQRGKGEAGEQGQHRQVGIVVLGPCWCLGDGGEPACAWALRWLGGEPRCNKA